MHSATRSLAGVVPILTGILAVTANREAGWSLGWSAGWFSSDGVRMSAPLLTPPGATELPPLLLTVEQAARVLSVGRTAVYHLIWDGQLQPVRIGRSVRFTLAQLEQFVTACAERGQSER